MLPERPNGIPGVLPLWTEVPAPTAPDLEASVLASLQKQRSRVLALVGLRPLTRCVSRVVEAHMTVVPIPPPFGRHGPYRSSALKLRLRVLEPQRQGEGSRAKLTPNTSGGIYTRDLADHSGAANEPLRRACDLLAYRNVRNAPSPATPNIPDRGLVRTWTLWSTPSSRILQVSIVRRKVYGIIEDTGASAFCPRERQPRRKAGERKATGLD